MNTSAVFNLPSIDSTVNPSQQVSKHKPKKVWSWTMHVDPEFVRQIGGANAILVYKRILFWFTPNKGDGKSRLKVRIAGEPWLAKTVKEMGTETGLTYGQVRKAISILKKHNIIETKVKKFWGEPTLHFRPAVGKEPTAEAFTPEEIKEQEKIPDSSAMKAARGEREMRWQYEMDAEMAEEAREMENNPPNGGESDEVNAPEGYDHHVNHDPHLPHLSSSIESKNPGQNEDLERFELLNRTFPNAQSSNSLTVLDFSLRLHKNKKEKEKIRFTHGTEDGDKNQKLEGSEEKSQQTSDQGGDLVKSLDIASSVGDVLGKLKQQHRIPLSQPNPKGVVSGAPAEVEYIPSAYKPGGSIGRPARRTRLVVDEKKLNIYRSDLYLSKKYTREKIDEMVNVERKIQMRIIINEGWRETWWTGEEASQVPLGNSFTQAMEKVRTGGSLEEVGEIFAKRGKAE